jgi:hypothetical protein
MPLTESALDAGRAKHREYVAERLAEWDSLYGRYSANPRDDTDEVAAMREALKGDGRV